MFFEPTPLARELEFLRGSHASCVRIRKAEDEGTHLPLKVQKIMCHGGTGMTYYKFPGKAESSLLIHERNGDGPSERPLGTPRRNLTHATNLALPSRIATGTGGRY